MASSTEQTFINAVQLAEATRQQTKAAAFITYGFVPANRAAYVVALSDADATYASAIATAAAASDLPTGGVGFQRAVAIGVGGPLARRLMATGDSVKFSNIGAITTSPFALLGGRYSLAWQGSGGSLQLQALSGDGTNYVPVGAAITTLGMTTFDLPGGQFRFSITTSTGNFLALTNIPYR